MASKKSKRPESAFVNVVGGACLAVIFLIIFVKNTDGPRVTRKQVGLHTVTRPSLQTPLRFAMIHDVIHQRFKKHGPAWYQQRIKNGQKVFEFYQDLPENRPLMSDLFVLDDMAVAYERLHKIDEGIAVLELKQKLLHKFFKEPKTHNLQVGVYFHEDYWKKFVKHKPLTEIELSWYRHYANYGTLLIHKAIPLAMRGDDIAIKQLEKAAGFIAKSIAINPNAHFGREKFQLLAVCNLIVFCKNPELLNEYTLFGTPLEPPYHYYGRSYSTPTYSDPHEVPENLRRRYIKTINCSSLENLREIKDLGVPFDELSVGIMGMWIYGGGANPHFALSLGLIMEVVGHKRIAWAAYRRALDMKERFWPDSKIAQQLADHCRSRMAIIEEHYSTEDLLKEYEYNLHKGQQYQADQAAYEADMIKDGLDIRQPDFFDTFNDSHGSIASPVGKADIVTISSESSDEDRILDHMLLAMFLGGALFYYYYRKREMKRE